MEIKDLTLTVGRTSTTDDVVGIEPKGFDVEIEFTEAELNGHKVQVEKVLNLPSDKVMIENITAVKLSGIGSHFSLCLRESPLSNNRPQDVVYFVRDIPLVLSEEKNLNYQSFDGSPRMWIVVKSFGGPMRIVVQVSGRIRR